MYKTAPPLHLSTPPLKERAMATEISWLVPCGGVTKSIVFVSITETAEATSNLPKYACVDISWP